MEGICKRPTACRLGLACKVRLSQRSSRKSRSRESQLKSRMDFAGGLNLNDEAGFTEGNEDHKGKSLRLARVPTGSVHEPSLQHLASSLPSFPSVNRLRYSD